jgi:hypothetical protein
MRNILVAVSFWSLSILAMGSLLSVGHTQSLPAPTVDRVGFPADYRSSFTRFYTFERCGAIPSPHP